MYLAAVIDLFSGCLIGWSIADHHRAGLVRDALAAAAAARGGGLQGSRRFVRRGGAHRGRGAIHIADRWHLWHNLAEAAERIVSTHLGCLRDPAPPPTAPAPEPNEPAAVRRPDRIAHRFRDRVHGRHAAVRSPGSVFRKTGAGCLGGRRGD